MNLRKLPWPDIPAITEESPSQRKIISWEGEQRPFYQVKVSFAKIQIRISLKLEWYKFILKLDWYKLLDVWSIPISSNSFARFRTLPSYSPISSKIQEVISAISCKFWAFRFFTPILCDPWTNPFIINGPPIINFPSKILHKRKQTRVLLES